MTTNNNKKTRYVEVNFKDSEDTYKFRMLSVREVRQCVLKMVTLLAPAAGVGLDMFKEAEANATLDKECIEAGMEPPNESVSVFSLASVISTQAGNPVVDELCDLLLEGAVKNDEPYNLDDEEGVSGFPIYMKLVLASAKVNLQNPLVACLNEMGYAEIVTYVQTALEMVKVAPK